MFSFMFFSRQQQVKTPLKSGGSRNRTTPSPPTSVDLSFKTPQKPFHSMPRAELVQQQQRCKSEPKTSRGRSVTPPTLSSSSPLTFAGPKCLEPPTPTSLPRPPTTWTRSRPTWPSPWPDIEVSRAYACCNRLFTNNSSAKWWIVIEIKIK